MVLSLSYSYDFMITALDFIYQNSGLKGGVNISDCIWCIKCYVWCVHICVCLCMLISSWRLISEAWLFLKKSLCVIFKHLSICLYLSDSTCSYEDYWRLWGVTYYVCMVHACICSENFNFSANFCVHDLCFYVLWVSPCAWCDSQRYNIMFLLVYRNLFFLLCESLFLSKSVRLISAAESLWCANTSLLVSHGWLKRLF
jgi:hypothetical protein